MAEWLHVEQNENTDFVKLARKTARKYLKDELGIPPA